MLYEVMLHCRNFFPGNSHDGTFTIAGGALSLPASFKGYYYLIEGSVANDGVYSVNDSTLKSETFTGTVTELYPPKSFLDLVKEIEDWQEKNGTATASPYVSESFGGYSYSKATGSNGQAVSWREAFSSRLKLWRML